LRYTYLGTKLKQKNIYGNLIEINTMVSDSDTDTWHWQCHVSHTETWHVIFLFYFFKI